MYIVRGRVILMLLINVCRWGPSSPPPKGGGAPNFLPMLVVAKWLHGLITDATWYGGMASAQSTLC